MGEIFLIILGVALGIAAVIALIVFTMKNFWVSRVFGFAFAGAAIFFSVKGLLAPELFKGSMFSLYGILLFATMLMAWTYMMGPALFDSDTDGDVYLIFGTLFEDTNHPVAEFFKIFTAFIVACAIVLWLSVSVSFYVGLVWSGIAFIFLVGTIIEWIRA